MTYLVLIHIESDETGSTFDPGDKITGEDFPPDVIKNWIEIGVVDPIVEADDGSDF